MLNAMALVKTYFGGARITLLCSSLVEREEVRLEGDRLGTDNDSACCYNNTRALHSLLVKLHALLVN